MKPLMILTIIFLLIIHSVFSQDCHCDKALQQDLMSYEFDKEHFLTYLETIDDEQFSTIKKSGGFNFKVPIKMTPIEALGNYNQFTDERERLFEQHNYAEKGKESLSIITKRVSNQGFKSFEYCLSLCTNVTGLYVVVEESDIKTIQIKILYLASRGVDYPLIISSSQLKNATQKGQDALLPEGTKLSPGSVVSIILDRKDNEQVYGVLNGSINRVAYSSDFRVNPYYIPKYDTITERIRLSEGEACTKDACGKFKNLIAIDFLQAFVTSDNGRDCPSGCLVTDPEKHKISYGAWKNDGCNSQGNGWNVVWGTCGQKDLGTGQKGCDWVDVEIKHLSLNQISRER